MGRATGMKIAICFFGITRNLKDHTLDSIKQHLLAPVADLDPAYKKFGHFNLVPRLSNPRSGEADVPIAPDESRFLNCDVVAHTDQSWLDHHLDYEQIQKYGDNWKDNFTTPKILPCLSVSMLLRSNLLMKKRRLKTKRFASACMMVAVHYLPKTSTSVDRINTLWKQAWNISIIGCARS